MPLIQSFFAYFAGLQTGKIVLWCYLAWYLATVGLHFDPTPSIWLSSLGIGTIIGIALLLSVSATPDRWQTLRLFMMPFCVSSFSSLIKGKGYVLIFPPTLKENLLSLGCCATFLLFVFTVKACILPRSTPARR